MKVTLIYCAVAIAGFNDHRDKFDREGWVIGHGIASIGAAVKAAGHEVDLIDLRQLSGWEALGDQIRQNPAEVYGLSIGPADHDFRLEALYQIKANAPQAKIIVGGLPPTLFPEEYNYPTINTVVAGEGEITFPKLLEDIDHLPRFVQGEKPDLNKIPWVDRSLFDYKKEMAFSFAPGGPSPSVTMLAGRGCPYNCWFCQPAENAVFGTPYRLRSPYHVCSELTWLHREHHFKSITFWDDTFTVDRKWVDQFCSVYEKTGIGAEISACSRADIICRNEKMVQKLAEIGLKWMVIGFESGSQRLLDLINKGTTVKENYQAAQICRKYGIKVFATFILGLPTETTQETTKTIDMITDIQPDYAHPFWYVPIRGTKLYDLCKKNELILQDKDKHGISRTGVFRPTLQKVNYEFIREIMDKRLVRHDFQEHVV
jgi:radical SAM superfamily enzyme YgiQ (UPF0313 family)